MKLALKFLALLFTLAVSLKAEEPAHTAGCQTDVGSYTNRLNMAVPGDVSSSIDLQTTASLYVFLSGSAKVGYAWSHDNSRFDGGAIFPTTGNWCLEKRARYVRLTVGGNMGTTATAATAPGTMPSGSATISGGAMSVTVTAIAGTAATSYFDKLTATATSTLTAISNFYGSLTTQAASIYSLLQGTTSTASPVYTVDSTLLPVSVTSRVVSGPTLFNLTHAAGVSVPVGFSIAVTGTTTVGLKWAEVSSSMGWPTDAAFSLLSVNSLKASRRGLAPGWTLALSPTSATDITPTAALEVYTDILR